MTQRDSFQGPHGTYEVLFQKDVGMGAGLWTVYQNTVWPNAPVGSTIVASFPIREEAVEYARLASGLHESLVTPPPDRRGLVAHTKGLS